MHACLTMIKQTQSSSITIHWYIQKQPLVLRYHIYYVKRLEMFYFFFHYHFCGVIFLFLEAPNTRYYKWVTSKKICFNAEWKPASPFSLKPESIFSHLNKSNVGYTQLTIL